MARRTELQCAIAGSSSNVTCQAQFDMLQRRFYNIAGAPAPASGIPSVGPIQPTQAAMCSLLLGVMLLVGMLERLWFIVDQQRD